MEIQLFRETSKLIVYLYNFKPFCCFQFLQLRLLPNSVLAFFLVCGLMVLDMGCEIIQLYHGLSGLSPRLTKSYIDEAFYI